MEKDVTILLPKLGESIVKATIVKCLKKEGDFINKDEALFEVATDKVNSEIPTPVSGRIKEILVEIDQEVDVHAPLAVVIIEEQKENKKTEKEPISKNSTNNFYSPAVLRFARDNNISIEELDKIPREGRLSKKDVEEHLSNKQNVSSLKRNDSKHIKMSHMRKVVAEQMVRSFYNAPHATLINEVDVTDVVNFIKEKKEKFFSENEAKLTITSFAAKAICKAIKDFPLINSSLEEDTIIQKNFVNLGIAVHVEQGVQVPVIKNCHELSLTEIAKNITKLAKKARLNKLSSDDINDGSITLTNFGMAKVLLGIPIIRFPEVAIIGFGLIQKRPVVLDNDAIGIRSIITISLTFDHRVLDGIYGCGFLNSIKTNLEKISLFD
jgi:2-oxoglutarate dehydrogenase E2 component (dihydrolipoamide succinyltransferase)